MITISHITSEHPLYQQVFDVREEILRRPLGMSLKNEDLSRDNTNTIFIAQSDEENNKVVGCVLLQPINAQQAQLRAMAVYNEWQGKGVGKQLVLAAEKYAWENNFETIILHARKVALGFYTNMGYHTYGEEFTEVGIPHFMMEKRRG